MVTTKPCCTACHCALDHYHTYGDHPYCNRCAPCPDCARPSRGLGRCVACQACVVECAEQALFLLPRVLDFLQSLGLTLQRIPGLLMTESIPPAKNSNGFLLTEQNRVWLRTGQPAFECAATLARELTHAWQGENCPEQSRQLQEGLAGWVERRMYLSLGYPYKADALVCTEDHIHGDGLRLMLHLEDRIGTRALLEKVRTLTDFPMWLRLTTLLGL